MMNNLISRLYMYITQEVVLRICRYSMCVLLIVAAVSHKPYTQGVSIGLISRHSSDDHRKVEV